tara:strand:+ start:2706 stop:3497 length:792 start_codon:yes stop_codon:yes gene_type:complete
MKEMIPAENHSPSTPEREPTLSNDNIIEIADQLDQDIRDTKTIKPFAYYQEQLRELGINITQAEYITAALNKLQLALRIDGDLPTAANILAVAEVDDLTQHGEYADTLARDFLQAITASGTHIASYNNMWQPFEVEAAFTIRQAFGSAVSDEGFAHALAERTVQDLYSITQVEQEAVKTLPSDVQDDFVATGEILGDIRRIEGVTTEELKTLFQSHGRSALAATAGRIVGSSLEEPYYERVLHARSRLLDLNPSPSQTLEDKT